MCVWAEIASQIKKDYSFEECEIRAYMDLMEFLEQYPEFLSLRASKNRPKPKTREYYMLLADRFFMARLKLQNLRTKTIPDEMVSFILQQYFNYPNTDIERIKKEHKLAMIAENLVGYLLEMYIGKNLEKHGWVWCSGNFVKAVDLIRKQEDDSWELLQIKNRDNSENSSSSAIREGTKIKIRKWFRSYSRKHEKNWENFPDDNARKILSEEGFKAEVEKYIKRIKQEDNDS